MIKRVENLIEVGTPDVYFAHDGVCGWLELKCMRVERCKGEVKIQFRPGQYPWLRTHWKHGGLSVLGIWGADAFYFLVNSSIRPSYENYRTLVQKAIVLEELKIGSGSELIELIRKEHR